MKKSISLLLLLFIIYACESSKKNQVEDVSNEQLETQKKELIIDILSIVGKDKTAVERVLGKPENREIVKPSNTPCVNKGCDKLIYKSGKYEVVFINEKADWITISNVSKFDTTIETIGLLGLEIAEPDFNSPLNVIRWKDIQNIKEINFFDNGSGKLDYIYIKSETE